MGWSMVRANIGLLTEYPGLYARMNGLDYLLLLLRQLLYMQPLDATAGLSNYSSSACGKRVSARLTAF